MVIKKLLFSIFTLQLIVLWNLTGQESETKDKSQIELNDCKNLSKNRLLETIDSNEKRDTNLFNKYIYLSTIAESVCPDTAQLYLQKGASLAEEINFKEGIQTSYYKLAVIYFDKDILDTAIIYANKSLKASKTNTKPYFKNLLLLGELKRFQYEYSEGIKYLKRAESTAHEMKDTDALLAAYSALAINYRLQNLYNNSIDYSLKGLNLAKTNNDSVQILNLHQHIAYIYYNLPNYNKAKEHLEEGENYMTVNSPVENLYLLQLKAAVLTEMKDDKTILDLHLTILEKAEEQNNEFLYTATSMNIATFYIDVLDTKLAKEYLDKIDVNKATNDQLFNYYLLWSQVYILRKNYQAADEALTKANGLFDFESDYFSKGAYYLEKSLLSAAVRNQDSLYIYKEKGLEYLDSFYVNTNSDQVLQIEENYRNRIARDSIQILSLLTEKQEVTIRNRSIIAALAFVIFVIFFLLTFLYRSRSIEQKRINQILEKTYEEKENLLSSIAHEFQTPLSLIKGIASQLTGQDEEQNDQVKTIEKNSDRLIRATQQILRANQRKENYLAVNAQLFSLQEFLENTISDFKYLAKQRKIKLITNIEDKQDVVLNTDVEKLKVVISNILSNAIKFTPIEGVIKLNYFLDSDFNLKIITEDCGIGIKKTEIKNLFTRYYQGSVENPQGGFGIGLATVKEYLQVLNGSIKVESKLGQGSKFIVELPHKIIQREVPTTPLYDFSHKAEIPEIISPSTTFPYSSPAILIVEDNIEFCKYLEKILKQKYNLHFVHNGEEALNYLKKESPDLIITDWMMAQMDGIELVENVKKSSKLASIPILMLTARSLISDQIKALRVGIDFYLEKSVEISLLEKIVAELIQRSTEREEDFSVFSENHDKYSNLSVKDQEWLIQTENTIVPLLGNHNLTLEDIAVSLKISTKQLNRKIKLLTGFTAKKYIQELRYWEARRMLELKEYDSVKAVCLSVGFKSLQNFSKKFKERFGKNPSSYL